MQRMIDLIRASAVPANIVHSAAKGALSVPADEMVEILVYLASHNQVFGEEASLTLAGWDETSSQHIAADPATSPEVLSYLVSHRNLRPVLLPPLLENPAVPEEALAELAAVATPDVFASILKSPRAAQSPLILEALRANPNCPPMENPAPPAIAESTLAKSTLAKSTLAKSTLAEPSPDAPAAAETAPSNPPEPSSSPAEDDDVLSAEIMAYLVEHAGEIDAHDAPFHPIGGIHESLLDLEEPGSLAAGNGASAADAGKKPKPGGDVGRGSALQKISRLDVKGRIQLAMKGNKEDRTILVRDGTKVVALAVLESPKITDAEVEAFANQKNVLESLLRGISMKRRFMKNYNVVRNLVANPRTPLDVSLSLIKNLLIHDLKNISGNKDVPETIRKLALKMYKQKKDPSKKS
jgi:hypothetical protein